MYIEHRIGFGQYGMSSSTGEMNGCVWNDVPAMMSLTTLYEKINHAFAIPAAMSAGIAFLYLARLNLFTIYIYNPHHPTENILLL